MELYRYDTTEQAREYARRFGRAYAEVVTLYTVLPRHPDRPNDCIQIKWVLTKSPLDGLVMRRDFVILESSLEFQVHGKRAWVRSYRSIELAAVPDMRKELNCIRASMYDMGFVIVESDRRGYLDMTYLADMDVGGNVPSWANDQTLKFWLRSMFDIDRFMRENRLSRTPFLTKDQLRPLHSRKTCTLCRRNFGPLRKKTNCLKCALPCLQSSLERQPGWCGGSSASLRHMFSYLLHRCLQQENGLFFRTEQLATPMGASWVDRWMVHGRRRRFLRCRVD
ncbi:hypothetical protein Ae201684P_003575 [Aphanomyces euteiches]|nr:hypothetical protein Ae201684P_003575 [Aphanomyces euteiches]